MRPPNAAQGAMFTSAYAKYVDFTDGFLSAYNAANISPHRIVGKDSNYAGRMSRLENYCRSQPLSKFTIAVSFLYGFLETGGK